MDNLEEIIKTLNQEERKEVLEFIEDSRGYDKLFPKVLEFKKELEKDLAELPARYKKLDELKKKLEVRLKTHINWQPFDPDNPPKIEVSDLLVQISDDKDIPCQYHIVYDIDYEDKELKSEYMGLTFIPFHRAKAYAMINPSNL